MAAASVVVSLAELLAQENAAARRVRQEHDWGRIVTEQYGPLFAAAHSRRQQSG